MIFKPSFIEGDCIFCKLLTPHMHCMLHREKLGPWNTAQKAKQSGGGRQHTLLANLGWYSLTGEINSRRSDVTWASTCCLPLKRLSSYPLCCIAVLKERRMTEKREGRNPTVESGRKLTSILLQEIKGMMEGRSRSSQQLPVLQLSLVIHVCTVMFTSPSVSAGGDDSTTIPLFLMSAGGKTRQ